MFAMPDLILITGVATVTFGAALYWLSYQVSVRSAPPAPDGKSVSMLFDRGILHHTTQEAANVFRLTAGEHDWTDLRATLLAVPS